MSVLRDRIDNQINPNISCHECDVGYCRTLDNNKLSIEVCLIILLGRLTRCQSRIFVIYGQKLNKMIL